MNNNVNSRNQSKSDGLFWLFNEEIILVSQEKALSKSFKAQIIPSLNFHSLKSIKLFSPIFFVSKSGSTHSTQYQVAIFQALSSFAISITTQLSVSALPTQTFCPISVATLPISSPDVVEIIMVSISVVYLFLSSLIFVSISLISWFDRVDVVSITEELIVHKLVISKAKLFTYIHINTRKIRIFQYFIY